MNRSKGSLVSLVPNPATDKLNIVFNEQFDTEAVVTIVDIGGKVISEITTTGLAGKIQLNVSDFAKGLYFVSVSGNNNIYQGKFVKK